MSKILKIALGLGAVLVLQFSGVDSSVRAADAATNAVATATNAVAGATNAPAPPQTADSLSYPPGANAGNEQDLTWPIPGKTLENMGMTNELEFCLVNAVPHVEHEYRVVAYNLTGDTPGAEIVRFTLDPELAHD